MIRSVRRSLAGLLFGFAFACVSLAVSGWLLQRTAFNPDRTASMADVVLEDPAIKGELTSVIVDAATAQLGLPRADVQATVDQVASIPAGQALLAEVLHDAHAHMIGLQPEPVQITGPQMSQIIRNQAADAIPAVTLPVPEVHALSVTRSVLRWLVPATAIVAVILGLLGFATHPERSAVFRSLGFGFLLLAVLVAVLGYVVPRYAVPALVDSVWEGVPRELAEDSLPLLIGVVLLLVGAGLGLLAGSGMSRRRNRYNTPVKTYRYTEERNWS